MVREEVAVSMESGVTGIYSCQVGLSVCLLLGGTWNACTTFPPVL